MHGVSRDQLNELSQRKADVLSIISKWSAETHRHNPGGTDRSHSTGSSIEDYCPVAPPLEDFMRLPSDVSKNLRTKRFFEDIRQGDMVYAVVTSILQSGLSVELLACEWSVMARSIDDLGLKGSAFCPTDHIPTANPRANPLDTYRVDDTIRAVVLTVPSTSGKLLLSLSHLDATTIPEGVLGLVTREELPKYYRQISRDPAESSADLATYIRRQREFRNPAFLEMMREHLGVPSKATTKRWYSLLPGYCGKQVRPEDSADELTTLQSDRWSMKSVEEGIKLMKEDNISGALMSLNKAVEMSKKNVEALVARGALFARKEDFQRAIRDFEDALKLNRNHRNARRYLADTFYHLGQKFETDEPARALKLFKDALRLDPKFDEAIAAERRLTKHTQEQSEARSTQKEPAAAKSASSTAERLRKMLSTDSNKSNSKRSRRSPASRTPSPRDRKRSEVPESTLSRKSDVNGSRTSMSVEAKESSTEAMRRSVGTSAIDQRNSRQRTPSHQQSPKVQLDVDDLEAQLEAFRAAKKAQMLATNKDIHKRTFL